MLQLGVTILRATQGRNSADALFDFEGGPGFGVTEQAAFYSTGGAAYHRNRDMVFVDMRGTGASHPLRCREIEAREHHDAWSQMYPVDLVAACARQLSRDADLGQFNTANAAKDVEAVRRALGYDQIDITALSYGTTLALAYIAQYPARVRAAILVGTAPAAAMPPRYHGTVALQAMVQLFAACAAEADCHAAFSDPAGDFRKALSQLASAPDGRAAILAERVRALLYDPASSRRIPLLLRRAAGGDLAGLMAQAGAPPRVFADGLYLSITCSESFAHFPLAEAMRAAEATPFGSYRLARQAAACAHWPVAASEVPQPRGQLQTPVLFVAGEFDPVTPRAWAEDTKRQFPNSQILTLPGGGHGFPTGANVDTCLDPLLNRFLDSPDAGTLDASCIATMRPPPFATR